MNERTFALRTLNNMKGASERERERMNILMVEDAVSEREEYDERQEIHIDWLFNVKNV